MTGGPELVNASVAVGWSLVHFFWQGALLSLALGAALKISEKNSSSLRYLFCWVTLAGMAMCPVLTLSAMEFRASSRSSPENAQSTVPDSGVKADSVPSQIRYRSQEVLDWSDRHMTAIVAIWSVGAFLALARILISLAAVRRLTASSMGPAPEPMRWRASQLASTLGVDRPIRLVVSRQVAGPVVVGWRKPCIILPISFLDGLSLQEEEAILAHELAHIRRRDYMVNMVQMALEAMLFYQPAIWWVSRHIRLEREHCCDDVVLSANGSPVVYAKALTLLEEQRSMAKPELSLGVYGGNLSMRIKRLFERDQRVSLGRATGLSLASLAALTLAVLAVLSISAANRVSAQAAEAEKQQNPPAASATHSHQRPNMDCTYYDLETHPHPGVCIASAEDAKVFYCKQTDGEGLHQIQIGCEWKVQRMRDWEKQQQQSKQ